jgi:AcrR family transcriptional regulator
MTRGGAKSAPPRRGTPKSEETRGRILEAALEIFRERGFEGATMREIATRAAVATGAAYYYFDSKDAIVMAFYERAQLEMRPTLEQVLEERRNFDERLRGLVQVKLDYFLPNRKLLGALSAHTDPAHPLSPFSEKTRPVREEDTGFFARAVEESKMRLPKDLLPYLPRLLWLYQMGIILFWVYDSSAGQKRTEMLFDGTVKMIVLTLRLAGLPFMRPMHRVAVDLLQAIYGEA